MRFSPLCSRERISAEGFSLQSTEKTFETLCLCGGAFPVGLENSGADILKGVIPPALPWGPDSKVLFGKINGKHTVDMDIVLKMGVLKHPKLIRGDGFHLPEL